MPVVTCPKCAARVIPKDDGTCPSCRFPLADSAATAPAAAASNPMEARSAGEPEVASALARSNAAVNGGSAWESFKTGCGAIYGLLLCSVAVVVLVGGIWGLLGGGREAPRDPGAKSAAPRTLGGFVTEELPSTRDAFARPHWGLRVKYTGTEPLDDVVIEVTLQHVSRSETMHRETYARWEPGETKTIDMEVDIRPLGGYSWTGSARCQGGPVVLATHRGRF